MNMRARSHADTIYQPTDLNRRYREILDRAKVELARVRDMDGTSLVMLREEVLGDRDARLDELERLLSAFNHFMALGQALERGAEPSPSELGEWAWLRAFDREDLEEFAAEMQEALLQGGNELSHRPIAETLHAWKETAVALADETRRGILLGEVAEDEFVEAERPAEE